MTTPNPQHKVLTAVLTAQMAVFAMDEIAGTYAYRQDVKQSGNRFLKSIEGYTTQLIPLVYGVKDDEMFALMDYMQQTIQQLVTMRPEEMGAISAMIDAYRQNPEQTMEALGMAFVEERQKIENNN